MDQSRVTGEEIIEAMLGNLREGLEPLRYSVLAPGVYHVYLHERDYGRLQGIFPRIQQETRQALTEELRALEQAERGAGLGALMRSKLKGRLPKWMQGALPGSEARQRDYQAPAEGWQIAFHQDADGQLQPGDVSVHSLLTLPPRMEMGEGLTTKTVKTLRRDGQLSHQESYSKADAPTPRPHEFKPEDPLATVAVRRRERQVLSERLEQFRYDRQRRNHTEQHGRSERRKARRQSRDRFAIARANRAVGNGGD